MALPYPIVVVANTGLAYLFHSGNSLPSLRLVLLLETRASELYLGRSAASKQGVGHTSTRRLHNRYGSTSRQLSFLALMSFALVHSKASELQLSRSTASKQGSDILNRVGSTNGTEAPAGT